MIVNDGADRRILEETRADDEEELRKLIKNDPDLLPIEEFGMTGPLLVVGRETTLPSGAVDLAAIARSGELLVIEFKTGPDNADFRRALAQLLDYGSHLWALTFDEFESTVPVRYFASNYCQDERLKGLRSLEGAAKAIWPDMDDDELVQLRERITKQLSSGAFHYVLVSQRFTPTIQKTAEYLNQVMTGPRTYAVEIVRFDGEGVQAFETRTVLKPSSTGVTTPTSLDEDKFLDTVADARYRDFLQEFFETCHGLGYRFEWGSSGVSIRMPTTDRPEPLTVAWIFVPGKSGWMGLTDVNFGYDPWSANQTPSAAEALAEYINVAGALSGATAAKAKNLKDSAWHLSPSDAVAQQDSLKELLAGLITRYGGSE